MKTRLTYMNLMIAVITLAVALITGSYFHAEETSVAKEISFKIDQSYEACSFSITTEKVGNFNVYLYKSNSNEAYTGVIEDGTTCEIKVKNVNAGEWKVKVAQIAEETTEENTENEESTETTEDQKTELTSDEVIGKIKVSARAIDETAFSIGNVSVARDIVGLQYYFKDESIVVEWTDLSCGNVNVTIIDTNTSQILDKQTVEGTYYEFELPSLAREITIDVVPATSSTITGANTQYTVPVVNNPDAVITYEDREYTNRDVITVDVQLNDAYALTFICNEAEVKTTNLMAKGEYTYEIPITEGVNNLKTYVIDNKHNMRSTSYTIIRDSIRPALTLDMEYDGAATYDDVAYITGTIKDYDTFTINQVEPVVTGDGSFKAEYLLNDGVNVLEIRATDVAGNETLYTAEITKLVRTTPVWVYFLPPVGIILGIVGIVFFKKRGKADMRQTKNKADKKVKKEKRELPKFTIKGFSNLSTLQQTIIECAITAIVIFTFFKTVILWGVVPSESMQPTLNVADVVIANGLAYVDSDPQRGDIVIFKGKEGDMAGDILIKRVIGLPGDSLMFVDGYIYINGQLCYEEYLDADVETNSFKDYEVPEGCYLVLGDNRVNSYDSRYWNDPYITKADIKGKMIMKIPVSELKDAISSIF